MRKPYPLLIFSLLLAYPAFSQVTASFTTVSSVCTNTPVAIHNTSTNASSYFWSFCAAGFNSIPEAVNLGNPNGVFTSAPVWGSYVQDVNGNFYGLVTCYDPGHVVRLNFGNSLLNTPTGEDLGNFGGVIPNQAEGLQLLKVNNNWTAIIVGGSGNEAAAEYAYRRRHRQSRFAVEWPPRCLFLCNLRRRVWICNERIFQRAGKTQFWYGSPFQPGGHQSGQYRESEFPAFYL